MYLQFYVALYFEKICFGFELESLFYNYSEIPSRKPKKFNRWTIANIILNNGRYWIKIIIRNKNRMFWNIINVRQPSIGDDFIYSKPFDQSVNTTTRCLFIRVKIYSEAKKCVPLVNNCIKLSFEIALDNFHLLAHNNAWRRILCQ